MNTIQADLIAITNTVIGTADDVEQGRLTLKAAIAKFHTADIYEALGRLEKAVKAADMSESLKSKINTVRVICACQCHRYRKALAVMDGDRVKRLVADGLLKEMAALTETAITIKKVAEYLGVFNAKGQEVGGIYPGTMNLVMFRQDRGMFESLDAAIEAAKAINSAHAGMIGKIEARLSAEGVEFDDESAAVQCLSECVAPSLLTRVYRAEMEVRKAAPALAIGQEVTTVDGRLFFVVALLEGEQVKLRHVSDTYSITTSVTNIKGMK